MEFVFMLVENGRWNPRALIPGLEKFIDAYQQETGRELCVMPITADSTAKFDPRGPWISFVSMEEALRRADGATLKGIKKFIEEMEAEEA